MAKQTINLGTAPSGAGGDDRRSAWVKAIANFDELYNFIATAFNRSNILGAVGQSGGVPTGAIFEKGSNSNGEYTKFADGRMICTHTIALGTIAVTRLIGGVYFDANGQTGRSFPAAFLAPPVCRMGAFASADGTAYLIEAGAPSATSTQAYSIVAATSGNKSMSMSYIAIGRWY
ncbi:hypothetical protein [Pseudomonas hunanensis]|uniref:hypothetical protein n=1 Tax=Pseudomonas hunanensis TaxID=1247546 RepID=UPI001FD23FBD|nr:hypothetical protein [Pseudomonas hunanensis]